MLHIGTIKFADKYGVWGDGTVRSRSLADYCTCATLCHAAIIYNYTGYYLQLINIKLLTDAKIRTAGTDGRSSPVTDVLYIQLILVYCFYSLPLPHRYAVICYIKQKVKM